MKQIALFIAFFVMRAAAGQESLSIDLPEAKDVFILPPGSKMPLTRLEREDPQKQIGALVQPAGVRLTLKKGEALELMSDQSGAEEPSFAFLRDLPSDRLRGLTLRCGKFSKDSCRSLSRFRALEHLVVFCADLDIDELAEACPQLELLGIYPTRFRTDDLQGSVFGEATFRKAQEVQEFAIFWHAFEQDNRRVARPSNTT